MLIVEIKGKMTIDSALKKLKSKFIKTGLSKELFLRKEFKKKSVERREAVKKAEYLQKIRTREQNL
jgi:small subunit ribosomal protein S21